MALKTVFLFLPVVGVDSFMGWLRDSRAYGSGFQLGDGQGFGFSVVVVLPVPVLGGWLWLMLG